MVLISLVVSCFLVCHPATLLEQVNTPFDRREDETSSLCLARQKSLGAFDPLLLQALLDVVRVRLQPGGLSLEVPDHASGHVIQREDTLGEGG